MLSALRQTYSGVISVLRRYWMAYGGMRALLLSPYFHIAIVLSAAMTHYWLEDAWWETAISVLPNVLGFTLAGFTIWLGFGDENFRRRLATSANGAKRTSAFMGVSAGFLHFVIVQIIALLAAVWAKTMQFPLPLDHWLRPLILGWLAPIGNAIGFLMFIYALTAALAASLGVFRAASWYDRDRRDGSKQAPTE